MLAVLHIPKTAGTSLRVAFEQVLSRDKLIVLEEEEYFFLTEYKNYLSVEVLFGHFSWAFAEFLGANRRATVVRDPIERCLSQLSHWLEFPTKQVETRDDGSPVALFANHKGLHWNLRFLLDQPDLPQARALSNAQTSQLARHHIDRALQAAPASLELAMSHLIQCDVVGVTERLDQFVTRVGSLINREIPIPQRQNASSSPARDLVEGLPADLSRRLARLNEMDIELYECAKKLSSNHPKSFTYFPGVTTNRRNLDFSRPLIERPHDHLKRGDHLPIQFYHFIFDILDLTRRLSECNGALLDHHTSETEKVMLEGIFGVENVCVLGSNDAMLGADVGLGDLDESPVTLALIRREGAPEDSLSRFRAAARLLNPYGALCVINAISWSTPITFLWEAVNIGAEHGLAATTIIDDHAFFYARDRAWLLHALFRAKFRERFIVRTRIAGCDVLRAKTIF